MRFADEGSFTGDNLWIQIMAASYVREIDQTDYCQILLQENDDDFWVLGLNALDYYTSDFDLDNM